VNVVCVRTRTLLHYQKPVRSPAKGGTDRREHLPVFASCLTAFLCTAACLSAPGAALFPFSPLYSSFSRNDIQTLLQENVAWDGGQGTSLDELSLYAFLLGGLPRILPGGGLPLLPRTLRLSSLLTFYSRRTWIGGARTFRVLQAFCPAFFCDGRFVKAAERARMAIRRCWRGEKHENHALTSARLAALCLRKLAAPPPSGWCGRDGNGFGCLAGRRVEKRTTLLATLPLLLRIRLLLRTLTAGALRHAV